MTPHEIKEAIWIGTLLVVCVLYIVDTRLWARDFRKIVECCERCYEIAEKAVTERDRAIALCDCLTNKRKEDAASEPIHPASEGED